MQDNFKINEELKKILISDEKTKEYFLIHLLHNVYKSETPQDYKHFSLNDYEAFKGLIFNHDKPKNLYNSLSDVFNEVLNNDLINDTIKNYTDLVTTEGKNLINSVSRLLYLQDKYKDDEIGQKIDKKIKEWLEYIRSYDKNEDLKNTDKSEEAIKNTNERLYARLFYHIIMNCNYAIHCNANNEREFMDLWDYNVVKMSDLHEFIKNYLDNELNDAETNNNFSVIINNFINNLNEDINTSNFNRDKAEQIKTISDKHKIKLDNELEHTITQEQQDAFIEELTKAYIDYLKDNEVNIQDDEDIKNWHDKANNFINHLINYKGIALNGIFTMDYTLNHLAFNDYQKEVYKLNLDEEQEVKVVKEQIKESKTPTKKAKYKDIKKEIQQDDNLDPNDDIPISKLRNHSLKNKNTQERDYIMMSSTKQGNDLINGITSYANYNENIYSIQKRIKELENTKNKNASDKDQLNFLKEKLENRIITKEEIENEEKTLLNNKKEIAEKIKELDNRDDIRHLEDISKQIDKRLKEIQEQKNDKALVVQQSLFNSDIEYNGKYITTAINIDDFDLSKFTDEGITILLYMIDQIITNPDITDLTFDIDFIFNKMNNYKHNKKSVVRNEIKNLTDILYNMNIKIIKEDRLNNLEIGRELRVITGRQWTKDKKAIKDDNGLKSMTITFNDDFKKMILNSKMVKTKLGDTKQVNNLQYFKIPLDLITFKNKKARSLGLYILQQAKLNRKNMKNGKPLIRKMKELYFNDYLKLKYNKKQGQFKKDIVYKLEDYLNQLEDNRIILYNTDAFDKLRYDLTNQPIEEQKKIFDEETIEIRVIPQMTDDEGN